MLRAQSLLLVSLVDGVDDLLDLVGLLLSRALLLAEPFAVLGVGLDKTGGLGDTLTDWLGNLLGSSTGGSADGSVSLGPELLHVLGLGGFHALSPLRELSLECVSIVLLEHFVVLLDVTTHNVFLMDLGVEFGLFAGFFSLNLLTTLVGDFFGLGDLETWETLLVVGDLETTIGGTLHGTENTVTSGGAGKSDIKESLHGSNTILPVVKDVVKLAIGLVLTLELVSDLELGQEATGAKETSGVRGRVRGLTGSDTESGELLRISSAHGLVTSDGGEVDLADDSAVGTADGESVLLGVVLVSVLVDQTTSSEVIGLSFSAATVLGLVATAIGVALENLDEWHIY